MLEATTVRAVAEWASANGVQTPAFLFAPSVVRDATRRLRDELGGRISYAVKANANPLLLRELLPQVDAFNVTNVSHTDLLLSLGVQVSRITFIHPVVQPQVVTAILDRGVRRFVVDDLRGLRLLSSAGQQVSVTLRFLPPGVRESEFSYARFGAALEDIPVLAREASRAGAHVEGLSFFLGGSVGAPEPFSLALEAAAQVRRTLAKTGVDISIVNIGGGFMGSRSVLFRDTPNFFRDIAQSFHKDFGSDTELWSEPGRFLCQGAVALLSKVIACRQVGPRRLVYLDASAYGGLLDCFIHRGRPLVFQTATEAGVGACDVTGPVMDSHDLIRRNAALPELEEGTYVLVPNVGAYTWGMATTCEGLGPPAFVELPQPVWRGFAAAWYQACEEAPDPCAA